MTTTDGTPGPAHPGRPTWKRLALTAALAAALAVGVTALLVNIFERKQEAREPVLPRRRAHRRDDGPGRVGQELSHPVRRLPAHRRPAAHALRRQRGRAAHARRNADPRSVVAQSRLDEDPRLKTMWAGYAFATDFREERGHAYMLEDQTFTERQQRREAAGHVHPLPRLGLRALQEAGRRRSHQGLRDDEPDAVSARRASASSTRWRASTATIPRRCSCGSRGPASSRASSS